MKYKEGDVFQYQGIDEGQIFVLSSVNPTDPSREFKFIRVWENATRTRQYYTWSYFDVCQSLKKIGEVTNGNS